MKCYILYTSSDSKATEAVGEPKKLNQSELCRQIIESWYEYVSRLPHCENATVWYLSRPWRQMQTTLKCYARNPFRRRKMLSVM